MTLVVRSGDAATLAWLASHRRSLRNARHTTSSVCSCHGGRDSGRETGDACGLVSRTDAEAILGLLDGAAAPSGRGTNTRCTYHVRTGSGTTDVQLTVTWRDGFLAFANAKQTTGAVENQFAPVTRAAAGPKGTAGIEADMAKDSGMQKFLGVLGKLAGQAGVTSFPVHLGSRRTRWLRKRRSCRACRSSP